MMRLKLPNGVTTSEQTRYLASVIEAYGADGCADVTTRQNWQIRGVTLPDVPAILDGLRAVGLTNHTAQNPVVLNFQNSRLMYSIFDYINKQCSKEKEVRLLYIMFA